MANLVEPPVTDGNRSRGKTNGVHAYERLADEIWQRIDSGELGAGERLPSEEALAEETGVSRSTVREALRILEWDGCVERSSPRIMVVTDTRANLTSVHWRRTLRRHGVTFQQLSEAVRATDGELVRLAVVHATRDDIAALRQNLARQEEAYDDLREWSRLDIEFHMRIAETSQNPLLILVRGASSQLLLPLLYLYMDSRERAELSTVYHRRIVDEIEVGDSDTAVSLMKRHIDNWTTACEERGIDLQREVAELKLPAETT